MSKWLKTKNIDHEEMIIDVDCVSMLNITRNTTGEVYWVYFKGIDAPFRILSTTYYAIKKAIGLEEQDDDGE